MLAQTYLRRLAVPAFRTTARHFSVQQPLLFKPTAPLGLRHTPLLQRNDLWDHVRREVDNLKHDMETLSMQIKNGSLELNPIDTVIAANVACFLLTTLAPPLQVLFLAGSFGNPFPFFLSGFCPTNFLNGLIELALLHVVTRPMAVGANPKTFAALFMGATFMGAFLVAAGPGSYMGPLAGMASIWTFFTVRNPNFPIHIGLLQWTFEARQVMMFVTFIYGLQLITGSPSAAAFVGGVCWGFMFDVLQRKKIIKL